MKFALTAAEWAVTVNLGEVAIRFLKEAGLHVGLRVAHGLSMKGIDRLEGYLKDKECLHRFMCPRCGRTVEAKVVRGFSRCPACGGTVAVRRRP